MKLLGLIAILLMATCCSLAQDDSDTVELKSVESRSASRRSSEPKSKSNEDEEGEITKDHDHHKSPILRTHSGHIRGLLVDVDPKFEAYQFLGIPYAKAPTGHRRFQRPIPHKRFHRIFHAVHKPAVCPYRHMPQRVDIEDNADLRVKISEDCLKLNIWVPKHAIHKNRLTGHLKFDRFGIDRKRDSQDSESDRGNSTRRRHQNKKHHKKEAEIPTSHERHGEVPVLVFFHGGYYGAGDIFPYDGSYLAAYHDIVVVTVQYRVGVLGFAYGHGIHGNMGLWDQLMALRWVHKNINAFGGDHDRVTIAGQGFGAISVSLHLLSKHSRKYFKRAIIESSTFMNPAAFQTHHLASTLTDLAFNRVGRHHCRSRRGHHLVQCLKHKVHAHELERAEEVTHKYGFPFAFMPVVDGDFIRHNPLDIFYSRHFHRVPLLIGTTRDEGTQRLLDVPKVRSLLRRHSKRHPSMSNLRLRDYDDMLWHVRRYFDNVVPINRYMYEAVRLHYWPKPTRKGFSQGVAIVQAIANAIGDRAFQCPTLAFATLAAEMTHHVYTYHFTHQREGTRAPSWMGVAHGSEVPYVFGEPMMPIGEALNYTVDDQFMSRVIMAYWANFVKHGNPNGNHHHDRKLPHSASGRMLHHWPRFRGHVCPYQTLELHPETMVDKTRQAYVCGFKTDDCSFWYAHLRRLAHKKEKVY